MEFKYTDLISTKIANYSTYKYSINKVAKEIGITCSGLSLCLRGRSKFSAEVFLKFLACAGLLKLSNEGLVINVDALSNDDLIMFESLISKDVLAYKRKTEEPSIDILGGIEYFHPNDPVSNND